MSLQKAYFENLDSKRLKNRKLEVQFNPTELNFTKTAQFAEIAVPGLDQPVLQFIRGGAETLSLELFFDSTDGGTGPGAESVTQRIQDFYDLVRQDPDTHAAPRCRFSWGAPPAGGAAGSKPVSDAPFYFSCVVESVDRKFLLFSPAGSPLRARVTVKLREYKTVEQMIAGLNSSDHTKARVLKRRQRVEQLASEEYESPAEWRRIADANRIEDPRRVKPGTLLELPPVRTRPVTFGNA
jgi:Contractile injection system tube protein